MNHWLMKSEPSDVSIDDVLTMPRKKVPWYGVRNFQARNYMRNEMKIGDLVLFYHSSCPEPGVAGLAKVVSEAYPDDTQFDAKSKYFDEKSKQESPRWYMVDVEVTKKTRLVSLPEMRAEERLATMRTLQRGNRLSITRVTPEEFAAVVEMAG
jgi:predicted RNA-binding protein with PUA-like domain